MNRRIMRGVCLLIAVLFCLPLTASGAFAANIDPQDPPGSHLNYGPSSGKLPPDNAFPGGGIPGWDRDHNYCDMQAVAKAHGTDCQIIPACMMPGGDIGCGHSQDPGQRNDYNQEQFDNWKQDEKNKKDPNYDQEVAFITQCLKGDIKGTPPNWDECRNAGAHKYPPPVAGPGAWVAGQISKMASDALKEAAGAIGASVVWLLQQFAAGFDKVSTISLGATGIGKVVGVTTVLSVLIATFLLLMQFGKVAVSQQGGPIATAITGLAKWTVILAAYGMATQTALDWSDTLSNWLINWSFNGDSGVDKASATHAMQQQLGTLFAGLVGGGGSAAAGTSAVVTGGGVASQAVGVVIVIGVLCILAVGALWVEMLVRQAGIMILVSVMPIVLAGQVSDATKEWWPKARNALISLVLMKPMIVICFAIGFKAMEQGQGIRNIIVGLIIFILACVAWPVLARFMVFNSVGEGNAAGSGVLGAAGSSISAMFGGFAGGTAGAAAGAGAVGGGSGFTRALEADNSSSMSDGSNIIGQGFLKKAVKGGSGSFGSKVFGGVGLGMQAAAVGVGVLEGATANAASHAGLGNPSHGGGVVVPPRRHGESEPPPRAGSEQEEASPKPSPSPTTESAPPGPKPAPPPPPAEPGS